MPFRSKFTAAVATLSAFALFAGTAGAAAAGAPGAGDSYYPLAGNGGYDVSHYDIRLSYQPGSDQLAGTTTILAKATEDLTAFNLDFRLKVQSIRVNNKITGYRHDGGELTVRPNDEIKAGTNLTIVVTYADVPSQVKDGDFTAWTRTADGALAIGDPQMSAWWFPGNDHPSDKATFDVSVGAPDGVEVISNGVFKGTTKQINGVTRWNWRSSKPQATYLAFLAIGQFEVRHSVTANGTPVVNAYSTRLGEHESAAKASIERTPEFVEFLEGFLGPYPMDAMGGVVTPDLGYALENQTRPTYDGVLFRRGSNPYLVVHEMAHQWVGDSVSIARWKDVWLNEGFATYLEWLYSESIGEGTVQENATWTHGVYPADHSVWNVVVADPGVAEQFGPVIYERGALALHALRLEVGDASFVQILRQWMDAKKYGNATTEEFIALSEQVSGKQLDDVFQKWIFTTGKPATAPGDTSGDTSAMAKSVPTEPKSWEPIHSHRR